MRNKIDRIHAFDSIRAIMMILGVFLHSALTYCVVDNAGWPLYNSKEGHLFFDWLFGIIHVFRMPIFFIICGFFGALLFYKKSPIQMILNRLNRVLLPFIVFLLLLTPLLNLALKYTISLFNNPNEHIYFVDIIKSLNLHNFFPYKGPYHLWFLYYLMMFSMFTPFLFKIIKKDSILQTTINHIFDKILCNNYFRIVLLSTITYIIIYLSGETWIDASISFIPNANTFIFHFLFYIFGWLLFISKKWFEYFSSSGWKEIIFGILLFSFLFIGHYTIDTSVIILINSLVLWFFCFGFFGLFIKHLNTHNTLLKYVCDSSYWIYLLHLPLTIFLPGLLVNLALPIGLKFIIVVSITLIICIFSYHFLVRKSFIGMFLNGRKFK